MIELSDDGEILDSTDSRIGEDDFEVFIAILAQFNKRLLFENIHWLNLPPAGQPRGKELAVSSMLTINFNRMLSQRPAAILVLTIHRGLSKFAGRIENQY